MEPVQDKLRELIARHCGSLRTNTDMLAGFIARMNAPDNISGQPARDALHIAHQIAGAGGSIGFAEMSVIASDIEHALQPIVAVNGAPSPTQRALIDNLVRQLRDVAAGLTPESSTLFHARIDAVGPARRLA